MTNHGAAFVQEDTGGDAQHALAQALQAPAFAGGALDEHPSSVGHVVGERVEQQDRLVLETTAKRDRAYPAVASPGRFGYSTI